MPDGVSVAFEPKICRYPGLGPDLIADCVTVGHVHWTKPPTELFPGRAEKTHRLAQFSSLLSVSRIQHKYLGTYLSLEPNNVTDAAECCHCQ